MFASTLEAILTPIAKGISLPVSAIRLGLKTWWNGWCGVRCWCLALDFGLEDEGFGAGFWRRPGAKLEMGSFRSRKVFFGLPEISCNSGPRIVSKGMNMFSSIFDTLS